jgi:hypothetical protein
MFKEIIKSAKHKLLSSIDIQDNFLQSGELLENFDIQKVYIAYFKGAIDRSLYEERLIREASIKFGSEDVDIHTIYSNNNEQFPAKTGFDSDELDILISTAVETRLNMLIRPRTTLKWFVFQGDLTKTYDEIQKRLNYIADYAYLVDGLKLVFEDKSEGILNHTIASVFEFEKHIEKIDKALLFSLSPEQFADLCEPIFDFFSNNSDESKGREIPIKAMAVFLDDKDLADVAVNFEQICRAENIEFITKQFFLDFINDILA